MATPSPERLLAIIELQNAIAAAAMNADEVMRVVAERAAAMTSASAALVELVEGDELVVRAVASSTQLALGSRQPKDVSLGGRALAERGPMRAEDEYGPGSALAVPLLYGESPVGAVIVMSSARGKFSDPADAETLRLLGQVVAIALHRAFTYPKPRVDTQHDALTGLGNRRAFEERIAAELGRNKRYGHSFSLALVALRGLETANDRYGQAAADEALRVVANIVRRHTRVIDACFRLSGDQLAIVMPGTSAEGARIVADRCRAQIVDAKLCEGAISPRFGIVEGADDTADGLVARASAAYT
jgi:diguanylate cyclase (GGDEF)-like protein|nr:sensor domain-containing diguanylate cyclase [Kofleriaceae bacterium]